VTRTFIGFYYLAYIVVIVVWQVIH